MQENQEGVEEERLFRTQEQVQDVNRLLFPGRLFLPSLRQIHQRRQLRQQLQQQADDRQRRRLEIQEETEELFHTAAATNNPDNATTTTISAWSDEDKKQWPPLGFFFAVQLKKDNVPKGLKIQYRYNYIPNSSGHKRLDDMYLGFRLLGRDALKEGVSHAFFPPNDLVSMAALLGERRSYYNQLVLDKCDDEPFHVWMELCGLLRRCCVGVSNLKVKAADSASVDEKLALLPNCFPNLKGLSLSGPNAVPLPTTLQSLCQVRFLLKFDLSGVILTEECLYNLADSIENLWWLKTFLLHDWIVHQDPESGFEALFCSLGMHRRLSNQARPHGLGLSIMPEGRQYLGDLIDLIPHMMLPNNLPRYGINEHHYRTFRNGPTCHQVLTQMKRQNRLPAGFPEDNLYNGNLAVWVEALIAVKDVQLKGNDWWGLFHFLFSQLGYDAFNNPDYWDSTNPEIRVPWSPHQMKKRVLTIDVYDLSSSSSEDEDD